MKKSKKKAKMAKKIKPKAAQPRHKVGAPTKASGKTTNSNKSGRSFGPAGVLPLGDRVLVRPQPPETTTSFGLIIPDTAREKSEQGVVVAVGPGRRNEKGERIALDVKVGDRVYFKKPWDEPMKLDGAEYYVLPESDITLIIK